MGKNESGLAENMKEIREIENLREKLDEIDSGILELFEERMALVELIGLAKKQGNLPVEDRTREVEIYEKVAAKLEAKNLEGGLALMKALIEISKNRQSENDK